MATKDIYGGRTSRERRDERHARLVDAATDLWTEQGWTAVTMRAVCARAGLTDRYFYESFDDRDALLVAVWERVRDEIATLVLAAASGAEGPLEQLGSAIGAVVDHIRGAPARTRIALGEADGCAPLRRARQRALRDFTDLLIELGRPHLRPGYEAQIRMTTLMAVGGFAELATSWVEGTIDADRDAVVRHVTDVAGLLIDPYLVDPLPGAS